MALLKWFTFLFSHAVDLHADIYRRNKNCPSIVMPRNCAVESQTVYVYGTLFFSMSFLSPMTVEFRNFMTWNSELAHSISVGGRNFGSVVSHPEWQMRRGSPDEECDDKSTELRLWISDSTALIPSGMFPRYVTHDCVFNLRPS